ncbi:glycosyltransferase family 4 protein [Candidatus Gottesmanbacteria bacterium]|nr:glycosyltransferase family 4 protein [Candidatus Gottesmanbacteria bacterium]
MIIAIDGYEANHLNRVGIGRYAFEILKHLYEIEEKRLERNEYRIYLPSVPLSDLPKETSWWKYRVIHPRKFWTFIAFPLALTSDMPRAHVVFSPTHYAPRFVTLPRVISIMDLSYLRYPELFRPRDLFKLTQWTKYSAVSAKAICTISEFSRHDILHEYRVDPAAVVVTYPGISFSSTKNMDTKSSDIDVIALPKKYILSVGTLQPRKNYVRLIDAFSRLKTSHVKEYSDVSLLIVGKKGWLYDEILHSPKKYGVESSVRFLDFVEDSDLPSLYKKALCFVLPSLYEGFGLPILEAMAYACPVVVSNVSSLPEIALGAGVYVEPENIQSIVDGIHKAIVEKQFDEGKKRIKTGLAQVKKFSWENAAKKTLEILEKVGQKGKTHE